MNTSDHERPTVEGEDSSCDTSGTCCPIRGGGKSLLIGVLVLAGIFILIQNRSSVPPAPTAIAWVEDYNAAVAQAAEKNQPALLAFEATWCGPCRWMENEVFSKPAMAKTLGNWVSVHIDVDKKQDLSRKYEIEGMPTFVVLSPAGKEVGRISGALPIEEFTAFLVSTQAKIPASAVAR